MQAFSNKKGHAGHCSRINERTYLPVSTTVHKKYETEGPFSSMKSSTDEVLSGEISNYANNKMMFIVNPLIVLNKVNTDLQ